jgi:glycosyltransferase involved in cell wall biosynthesis
MKVLTIWPAGMAPNVVGRLGALQNLGVEVALLCARRWPEGGSMIEASATQTPVRVYALSAALTGKGPYYFYPKGIGRVVSDFEPDLIHLREEVYTVFGGQFLATRKFRFPRFPFVFESWQNIRKRYGWPAGAFEAWGYRSALGAIAGAPSVETVLREGGFAGLLEMIPLGGVNLDVFKPSETRVRNDAAVVGYAGRIVPDKGLDMLVQAAALIPDLRLKIAGDGPWRPQLQALAASLGVGIELLGPLPQDRVPDFLRSLDVLALPSRTTPRWKEQWGRVLTEAMACGVPVVASDSGEIPFVIDDAGLIFPEGSVEDLASALRSILGDDSLRKSLIARGFSRAREFSWQHHAEQTKAFYEKLLG